MKKLCIVKYDELEKPIELVEVKEFSDIKELTIFRDNCLFNKKEYNKRLQEKAENERLEKQKVDNEIKSLQNEIKSLKSVISHLLGNTELTEEQIAKILGEEEHE